MLRVFNTLCPSGPPPSLFVAHFKLITLASLCFSGTSPQALNLGILLTLTLFTQISIAWPLTSFKALLKPHFLNALPNPSTLCSPLCCSTYYLFHSTHYPLTYTRFALLCLFFPVSVSYWQYIGKLHKGRNFCLFLSLTYFQMLRMVSECQTTVAEGMNSLHSATQLVHATIWSGMSVDSSVVFFPFYHPKDWGEGGDLAEHHWRLKPETEPWRIAT